MGPSGSGKTTLLNFVTGNISGGLKADGHVQLNGQMGFVPQQDHLHGFYTCRSYMRHYTRLVGLDDNVATAKLSMDLLIGLGLDKHADTIVGDLFRKGLSGGQQRRLSVALEALSSPETLFLDEPTSGLDSESAYQVMKFLDSYARASGRRVILTIHQPSSFIWKMIDNVVLLSKGKLMYQGPRSQMESFFAQNGSPCPPEYNPADHYVTVVNDEFTLHEKSVEAWADAFEQWQKLGGMKDDVELALNRSDPATAPSGTSILRSMRTNSIRSTVIPSSRANALVAVRRNSIRSTVIPSSRANALVAVFELTRRYLLNLWLNPGILGTRVIMYSMLSGLIGMLFWDLESSTSYASVQSRIALLFYCVSFFVFMSVAAVPFAVMERGIVEKEVRNGYYHPAIFQAAQSIASIPGTFVLALITTVITVSMTGLRAPIWYFLNTLLALNCAEGMAQLVSHIVPHFIIGIALIAGLYGMFMLLPGFVIVPSEFPSWLGWTYNIAFHTYSWRSFMFNEFSGDDMKFDSVEFPTGMDVLRLYEIEDVDPTFDMIVLVGYAVVINLVSFLVLHVKYVSHNTKQVTTEV